MTRIHPLLVLLALLLGSAAVPATAGVNLWTSIGPEGGAVFSLAAAPGVIYAGTPDNGVFKSVDGGASWSPVNAGLPLRISSVAADPTSPAIAYALPFFDRLYKTVNGGASWFPIGPQDLLYLVAVAPSDPGTLYAANSSGLFKSTDQGASWTALAGSPPSSSSLEIDPQDPRTVYVASGSKVFRTRDGGATWVAFEPGFTVLAGSAGVVQELAVDPREPSTLYAATLNGDLGKSTDRGATWTRVRAAGLLLGPRTLEVDPASGAVYAVYYGIPGFSEGQGGIWKSADGGAAWTKIFPDRGAFGLAFDPGTPGRVIVGVEMLGVYRSEDGGATWAPSGHGLRAASVPIVVPDPHVPGRLYAVADPLGPLFSLERVLLRSDDGGAGWDVLLGNPETASGLLIQGLVAHPTQPGTLYLAGRGILRTTNGGATWESLNRGLRPGENVAALALAPSNPNVLYAIGWDKVPNCTTLDCPRVIVFRSTDGGAQWRRSRPPLSRRELLHALAVDPVNPAVVYVAGNRFLKSTDGGVTWTQARRGPRGLVTQLATDPFASGTLYAVVRFLRRGIPTTGIDRSTDGGATWAPGDGFLPGWFGINQVTLDPTTPGTLYASTDHGVFVSPDRGNVWTLQLKEGLPARVRILTVAVDPSDPRTLYAGTSGGGGLFVRTRVP